MLISIIIPTYNEDDKIGELVLFLKENSVGPSRVEVIVSDGCSTDGTTLRAAESGAIVISGSKGRAEQMNRAAAIAKGNILFFLHADTRPSESYVNDLVDAVQAGYSAGCYRLSFDYTHWFLRLNCWFTRFNFTPFRFGDQSLFVTREIFKKVGGFDSRLLLMEDQEIVRRIKKAVKFIVFKQAVETSARKYLENGILRLQLIFVLIYLSYKLGVSQRRLFRLYHGLIREPAQTNSQIEQAGRNDKSVA
jgi:rSAM/selenodomain-associated transferase 2